MNLSALCKAAVHFDGTNRGLNKTCASSVIDVISDNGNGWGSNELRGSIVYMLNPGTTIQPGCWSPNCNHQICIQIFYAACHPDNSFEMNKFRGDSCDQLNSNCAANVNSSKLGTLSSDETGCFCVNTSDC